MVAQLESGRSELVTEGRGGWGLWQPRDGGNVTRLAAITFSISPNCVCANEMPTGPRGVISNTAQRLVPLHLEQKEQRVADTVGAADGLPLWCGVWPVGRSFKKRLLEEIQNHRPRPTTAQRTKTRHKPSQILSSYPTQQHASRLGDGWVSTLIDGVWLDDQLKVVELINRWMAGWMLDEWVKG